MTTTADHAVQEVVADAGWRHPVRRKGVVFMSARTPQARAYVQADAQVLTVPDRDKRPHPEWRWDNRCPDEWEGTNVRAAWREATPIPNVVGCTGYVRVHEPSEMVLVGHYGVLQSAMHLSDVPPDNRQQIRDHLQEPNP